VNRGTSYGGRFLNGDRFGVNGGRRASERRELRDFLARRAGAGERRELRDFPARRAGAGERRELRDFPARRDFLNGGRFLNGGTS